MAFEGDLSNLSLGDVLQTIAGSRQIGTFVIRGAEERRLGCGPEGLALLSARPSLALLLGKVLVGTGKVSAEQLDEALKVQRRRRDARIGEILEELGACTAEDVRGARRYIAAEEIYELFMWREGKFEFIAGEPDGSGLFADLKFDAAQLAMESAHRIDEMPRALAAAPPGEVFVRTPDAKRRMGEIESNLDLMMVLALIDGSRTMTDVHEAHFRGRFDTWKAAEALIERGFLRPATLDEVTAAARAAVAARDFIRAARLYERAAEHAPEDDSHRQAMAEALRDAGEKRRAAEQLVRIAHERFAAGRLPDAVKSFREAIALDADNADAHEGLMHGLIAADRADEAVEAALAAAALRASTRDFDGALRVVEPALAVRPDNPTLLGALANALCGLGRNEDAVKALDEAVRILGEGDAKDGRLVEFHRRILQIDPSRKDCEQRIAEIQASAATRRKRVMRRVALAAGVLVLATAATPFLRTPSVEARIAKAHALVDATSPDPAHVETARAIVESLADAKMSEDERIDFHGLKLRVEQLLHPADGAALKQDLDSELDAVYRAESNAVAEGRLADGLAGLLAGLERLDGQDARKLQKADEVAYTKVVAEAAHEVDLALSAAAAAAQKTAALATSVRDRFDANVWKREDLAVLRDLIAQSEKIVESTKGDAWSRVPELVRALVAKTRAPQDGSDKRTIEAVAVVVDAGAAVAQLHDRALLRARRKEIKEGYVATYAEGSQLRHQGRLEEALQRYEAFLVRCEELKTAAPAEAYAPVLKELFGGEMMLDQRIRTERDRVTAVVRDEAEAARAESAESAEDAESAFRIRKRLVHDNPEVDFASRFQMPLRIETAPPGADVIQLDGSSGGRPLGKTPLSTRYPIGEGAKFQLRLAGYVSHDFVRRGAANDVAGVERVVLSKIATWKSKPAGSTEAAPMQAPGAIVVSGRDGVIRRIDAATGVETARFASGLLDGFAGAAVLRGDRVVVAALDGKGWVLKLDDLSPVATFEAGTVRGAPLSTAHGVLVADESAGNVRLLGDDGRASWTTHVGKVKSDPAMVGDNVVVVTSDAEVILLSPSDGAVVRRRQLAADSTWGAPTVRAGRVFLGGAGGDVACLDAATLAESWTRRLDGPVRGRICATDLRVVACTGNGVVNVLDAETGNVLSTTNVGDKPDDGACGACDLADGGFVVVTKKGVTSRFDAKGSLVWRFDAGEDVFAPPCLLDGAVIVVTKKGVVISLSQ
jgi:outer membrane protein assembly factor BamB/tetratricopeptide (TPR) repeat protein